MNQRSEESMRNGCSTTSRQGPANIRLFLLLAAFACSDSPTGEGRNEPANLQKVGGDEQIGTVGTQLPDPLIVRVVNDAGRPVANQLVNFRVLAGGGSVFAGSALTNSQGIAQELWTLGTSTDGEQRVEARAVDRETGAGLVFGTFTATARAGSVAALDVTAGADQSALAATTLPIAPSVRARDQFGNLVPGAVVAFEVAAGGGTIATGSATTSANGVATAGSWTLGSESGTQTLRVSSGQAPAVVISARARSRMPAQLSILAGASQTAPVGTTVSAAPRVLVTNADGDPLPGVTVTFVPAVGSGTVTGAVVVTNGQGEAALGTWTLGVAPGSQKLTVVAGDALAEITATASVGEVSSLAWVDPPAASAEVGSDAALTVRASDRFGNPLAGLELIVEVLAGGGTLSSGTVTTGVDGRGSVTWTLGTAAGLNRVRVRAGTAPSLSVDVSAMPGAPARMTKHAGDNQSATVGTGVAVNPAILVADRFGNPVPNVAVTFAVGSGGGTTGSTAVTGADGIAASSGWTLGTTAGLNTVNATTAGLDPMTFTAAGLPGARASLTKELGDLQTGAPEAALPTAPTVRVRDAYGNPIPGIVVTFVVASGGGSVTGASPMTGATGVGSVGSWILGANGAQALTATVEGLAPVTFNATVQVPVASTLVAHPSNPATILYGDAVSASVIVTDQFGRPVSGVPVAFSSPDAPGPFNERTVITGASTFTDINGIATAGWEPHTCGLTTLTATATGVAAPLRTTAQVITTGVPGSVTLERLPPSSGIPPSDPNNFGRVRAAVYEVCGGYLSGAGISVIAGTSTVSGDQWYGGCTLGTTTIQASVPTTGGRVLRSNPLSDEVVPRNPVRLEIVEGNGQTGPAGSTLPIAPKVRAYDQCGNPTSEYRTGGRLDFDSYDVYATFTGLSGGSGSVRVKLSADGTATAPPWTLGSAVGQQTVTATLSSVVSLTITATFRAEATAPPDP